MKNSEILVFLVVTVFAVLSLAWFFDAGSINVFVTYVGNQVTDTIAITKLEINEPIGKQLPVLSSFHLLSLGAGSITTPRGRTKTTQTLSIRKTTGNTFTGGVIVFEEDENDVVSDFLKFSDQIFEYEITFEEGLRSKIEDGKLTNLHDRYLEMLGKTFAIIDTSVDTNSKKVSITLAGEGKTVEFRDTNYGDNNFVKGSLINSKNTEGNVKISATFDGENILSISSIAYRPNILPKTGTNIYVPKNMGVRDFMRYPEGLIMDGFDIIYGGLLGTGTGSAVQARRPSGTVVSGNNIVFAPSGNGYNLQFTNTRGQNYNFRLFDRDGGIKYGKGSRDFIFSEGSGYFIAKGDSFLVQSENEVTGVSNILKYDGIDETQKVLFFEDMATGSVSTPYDANGNARLTVNGFSYDVAVDLTNTDNIKVDLNRDGTQNSGTADAVVLGGGILEFSAASGTSANIVLRSKRRLFEERTSDETTTIQVSESDSRLDVDVSGLTMTRDKDGIDKGSTVYGALFLLDDRRDPSTLTIVYPGGKSRGSVRVGSTKGQQTGVVVVTFERFKLIQAIRMPTKQN